MRASAIVAALLLPPLGVYLSEGVTRNFWIAGGLTLLAFLPGVIFAELVVARPGLFASHKQTTMPPS